MNTVTKGTNRPAAAARSARHSQRTPLPPKGEVPQAAKQQENFDNAMILERAVPQYGRMTQPELLARAAKLGLSLPKSTPKGKLLTAIMEHERSQPKPKAEAPKKSTAVSLPPNPTNPTPFDGADTRSATKASGLAADLAQHGWTARRLEDDAAAFAIVLERGVESIHIAWVDGVFQYDSASYVCGERTTKIRNASQARQIGVRGSTAAQAEATKAVTNKAFKRRAPEAPRRRKALPIDFGKALDEEVISALLGRKVTWLNRISNKEEEAVVTPDRRHAAIIETDSGRVLKFIDHGVGYRAFRIEDIREVGAGAITEVPKRKPKRGKAEAEPAEAEEE